MSEHREGPGWLTIIWIALWLTFVTYAASGTDAEHARSIKRLEDCVRRLEERELRNLAPYPVAAPEPSR